MIDRAKKGTADQRDGHHARPVYREIPFPQIRRLAESSARKRMISFKTTRPYSKSFSHYSESPISDRYDAPHIPFPFRVRLAPSSLRDQLLTNVARAVEKADVNEIFRRGNRVEEVFEAESATPPKGNGRGDDREPGRGHVTQKGAPIRLFLRGPRFGLRGGNVVARHGSRLATWEH